MCIFFVDTGSSQLLTLRGLLRPFRITNSKEVPPTAEIYFSPLLFTVTHLPTPPPPPEAALTSCRVSKPRGLIPFPWVSTSHSPYDCSFFLPHQTLTWTATMEKPNPESYRITWLRDLSLQEVRERRRKKTPLRNKKGKTQTNQETKMAQDCFSEPKDNRPDFNQCDSKVRPKTQTQPVVRHSELSF